MKFYYNFRVVVYRNLSYWLHFKVKVFVIHLVLIIRMEKILRGNKRWHFEMCYMYFCTINFLPIKKKTVHNFYCLLKMAWHFKNFNGFGVKLLVISRKFVTGSFNKWIDNYSLVKSETLLNWNLIVVVVVFFSHSFICLNLNVLQLEF